MYNLYILLWNASSIQNMEQLGIYELHTCPVVVHVDVASDRANMSSWAAIGGRSHYLMVEEALK